MTKITGEEGQRVTGTEPLPLYSQYFKQTSDDDS